MSDEKKQLSITQPQEWIDALVKQYAPVSEDVDLAIQNMGLHIANLEKRLAEAGWQPIETAPKDGTELLLCSIHLYSPRTGCWATYHPNAMGKAGWRTAPICGDKLNPTHWMPLPPPPQENTHD